MWGKTLELSLMIFIVFVAFTYILDGSLALLTFSKSLAGTAAILIGASFALSGFCYYFDFLDSKIGYRKYLGLMGFWFAFAYSISLLIVNPNRYLFGFFDNFFSLDYMLGLIAMAVFAFMAVISNAVAMKRLGPQNWRRAMRLGYGAWLLLAIRAYFLEGDVWFDWLQSFDSFPPSRLLLSIFVIAVLVFRLSVEVSKRIHKRNSDSAENVQPQTKT